QLENATKKKIQGSRKIKARFLTAANLCEEFNHKDMEQQVQEQNTKEKEKKKEAETAERTLHVADDALHCNFSGRLASFKKDDLRALAITLSLSDKGTNAELLSHINDCFKENQELQKNSRFSGLFTHEGSSGHWHTHNAHRHRQQHHSPAMPVLCRAPTMNASTPPINFGDHGPHPTPPVNY
ncbi:hypothetical protein BJV74DRAFT_790851, partial [Russula compacta]